MRGFGLVFRGMLVRRFGTDVDKRKRIEDDVHGLYKREMGVG